MKKYFAYLKTTIKVAFEYRTNFFISMFFDLVWFLVFFSLWTSVYKTGDISSVAGFSLSNTITYYFVTEFIFKFGVLESVYLNGTVWNGYFTNDLLKPWNISAVYSIDAISDRIIAVLASSPAILAMIAIGHNYIHFSTFPVLIWVVLTVILGLFMNIAFNLCVHSLAFKYGDQIATIELANYGSWLLSGAFFPLDFLPVKIHQVFNLLPFRFLSSVPANLYLGKIPLTEIPIIWAQIVLWTIIFFIIHRIIYQRGLKYYTGTGR